MRAQPQSISSTHSRSRSLALIVLASILCAGTSRPTPGATGSVTYTYDDAGRLRTSTYTNGTSKTYVLDAAGNRTSVTAAVDATAPTVPAGLQATPVSQTQINVVWQAATDGGSGVGGYKLYRNGSQILSSGPSTLSFSDTGLSGYTTYTYTIAAFDNATPPNLSAQSAGVVAKTLDQTAPGTPTGLSASAASQSQINLSWTAATDTGGSGLGGYRIYRSGSQIGTSATTSYSDTGLNGFTTYSYTIAAYDNATPTNVSAQSSPASAKTLDQTAPTVPTSLSASAASETQINLSWAASSDVGGAGVAGYRVYRNGSLVGSPTTASYVDTGLAAYTNYSYTVAAYDAATPANTSAQSTAAGTRTLDQTAPTVPTSLSASAASETQINLSWAASSDPGGAGLAGYRVYRNGSLVGSPTTESFSDTGLAGYTNYSYTVAAYDAASPANTSGQSTAAGARTLDQTAPTVPSLSASAASPTQINLSWSASSDSGSGVGGYILYRNGSQIQQTAATSFSDTGLTQSTTYNYSVVAYDNNSPTNTSAAGTASATTLSANTTESATIQSEIYRPVSTTTYTGFYFAQAGSITGSLPSGLSYVVYCDSRTSAGGNVVTGSRIIIGGFTADPGRNWLISSTADGVTVTGAGASSYSYSTTTHQAAWFFPTQFGFAGSGNYPMQLVHTN
jgi:YD repeat-containing protein